MSNLKGLFLDVGDYQVDAEALMRLAYRCDPSRCRGLRSCCGVYDVWIDAEEKARLEKNLSLVFVRAGKESGGKCVDTYLKWVGAGYVLQKNREGLCRLACRADDGRVLCALHSAALHAGIPPAQVKPRSCLLWPLALAGRGHRTVSVQQDAYDFPCNRRREDSLSHLDSGTVSLIRTNFGEEFVSILERRLKDECCILFPMTSG